MNLHSIVNGVIQAVNQNLVGTLKQSNGSAYAGDATLTGSIAGSILTVSAVATGALGVNSVITGTNVLSGTMITALGTGTGGPGTYTVSKAQTVTSEPMTATGTGTRTPQYTVTTNVQMQFQALSSDDLKHVDGLNISTVLRSVHMNGEIQGLERPGLRGGDILLAPTRITGAQLDTWLVVGVPEGWDASGWSHVIVALQQATQSQ